MTEVEKAVEALAKALPVEKAYDDLAHGALTEVGKAATDVVRVLRLITAPVQFVAAYQVRLERYCQRIANKVLEANRIEPSPRIAGPVLEALRFADENDLVTELMLNLLASGMDKTRVETAHPAFAGIAVQLCADEALALFHLKRTSINREITQEIDGSGSFWHDAVLVADEFPKEGLARADLLEVYLDHLHQLGLADYKRLGDVGLEDGRRGLRSKVVLTLTDFGRLFAKACVPDELPPTGAP